MSLRTPKTITAEKPASATANPFLQALTAAVLAVTSLTGQTGCAALNAARVGVVGSSTDKKILALDEQAAEVNESDIPETKKQELLGEIEWNKKILKAYEAYMKRERELDEMRDEISDTKDMSATIRNVKYAIVHEYRNVLENPRRAPLKDMLTDEEAAVVSRLFQEIENANAALKDINLQNLSKFEWPELRNGGRATEEDVRKWVVEWTHQITQYTERLRVSTATLAQLRVQKAPQGDINFQEKDVSFFKGEIAKCQKNIDGANVVLKSADAKRQLEEARGILRFNPQRIKRIGKDAVDRTANIAIGR